MTKLILLLLISACALRDTSRGGPRKLASVDIWGKKWKISFEDHFNGRSDAPDRPECYDKVPTCMYSYSWRKECPEFSDQLRHLNKCTWDVYHYYNYMDQDSPVGTGINAFDGSQVSVKNGRLYLSAKRSIHQIFDCKRLIGKTPAGDDLYSRQCPFISGGIDSAGRGTNNVFGFKQKHGRWEIRAKIQRAPGAWPAIWLVPESVQQNGPNRHCGWPHSGELDIMEYWASETKQFSANFHSGDCASNTHVGKGADYKFSKNWFDSFHDFAVEWSETGITFIVDNQSVMHVSPNEPDPKHNNLPLIFPDNPLFMILNLTIAKLEGGKEEWRPDPENFLSQEMQVEYVKVYQPCDGSEPEGKCVTINTEDTVDRYNSEKNESAFAEVMAYPNPVPRGQNYKTKLMLKQDCLETRLQIYNILGQAVGPNVIGGDKFSGPFIHDGPMAKNKISEWTLDSSHLAAGMYLMTAKYDKCGTDQRGKGNHVFKFVVL